MRGKTSERFVGLKDRGVGTAAEVKARESSSAFIIPVR